MQCCQVMDCLNEAEPDDLLCRSCRDRADAGLYFGSAVPVTADIPPPEVVETLWGKVVVGGEGG